MTCSIRQWTLDVHDLELMAASWSGALGYRIASDGDGTCHLIPQPAAPPETPTVWLQHAGSPKTVKNRNHPDLRPDDPFVVLRDPEGNEFCVLRHQQH